MDVCCKLGIFLILSVASLAQERVSVKPSLRRTTILERSSQQFDCYITTTYRTADLVWLKLESQGGSYISVTSVEKITDNNDGTFIIHRFLVFPSFTAEDAGTYKCSLRKQGSADEWEIKITLQKICAPGKYGMDCMSDCSKFCKTTGLGVDESPCLYINGTCRYGCLPGYTGGNCSSVCAPGKYGINCTSDCSKFCKTTGLGVDESPCLYSNGTCRYGCLPGYNGANCSSGDHFESDQGLTGGAIAGIVLGCIAGVIIIISSGICFAYRTNEIFRNRLHKTFSCKDRNQQPMIKDENRINEQHPGDRQHHGTPGNRSGKKEMHDVRKQSYEDVPLLDRPNERPADFNPDIGKGDGGEQNENAHNHGPPVRDGQGGDEQTALLEDDIRRVRDAVKQELEEKNKEIDQLKVQLQKEREERTKKERETEKKIEKLEAQLQTKKQERTETNTKCEVLQGQLQNAEETSSKQDKKITKLKAQLQKEREENTKKEKKTEDTIRRLEAEKVELVHQLKTEDTIRRLEAKNVELAHQLDKEQSIRRLEAKNVELAHQLDKAQINKEFAERNMQTAEQKALWLRTGRHLRELQEIRNGLLLQQTENNIVLLKTLQERVRKLTETLTREDQQLDILQQILLKNTHDLAAELFDSNQCTEEVVDRKSRRLTQNSTSKDVAKAEGCKDGYYGKSCTNTCPANCKNGTCDQATGDCDCKTGYYGLKCDKNCSVYCEGAACNQTTAGCDCKTGHYGLKCDKNCSVHCKGAACNKTTAECELRPAAGHC